MTASATAQLGRFAASLRERPLPAEVVESARCHLLYNLACGLAAPGAATGPCAVVRGLRPAEATVLATGEQVPADAAAFANAALLHARAQDDTHMPSECHIGAVVIPVALALAEQRGLTPLAFLAGLVAGYEVTAAVGEPFAHAAIARGFRASMAFGTLGAAAAAGVLLGLDGAGVANAIALSTSLAGGLGEAWVEGTDEWMLHMGAAARNGIVAAQLSEAGDRGAPLALEGPAGFARAFAGRDGWQAPTEWELGERWRITEVIYKPYPVCNVTQHPVALAARLAREHDLTPDQVARVQLALNPIDRANPGTLNTGPFAGTGASLMSAPFCVAMAIKHRTATLAGLRELDDPVIGALIARIEVATDENLPILGARLRIDTTDGRALAAESTVGAGSFAGGWADALATARRLVPEITGGAAAVDALADTVQHLEELPDLRPLVRAATLRDPGLTQG